MAEERNSRERASEASSADGAATTRATDARFRVLTERASDAILELAADSSVIYASPRVREILGHPASEMLGKAFFSFIHHSELDQVERLFEQSIADQEALELLFRGRHRSGAWVWLEVGCRPYATEDGAVHSVLVCRDASARVRESQVAEAQRDAEARIGELARRFVSLGLGSLDDAIQETIEAAAQLVRADRGYLISLVRKGKEAYRLFEWDDEGIESHGYRFGRADVVRHEWVYGQLQAGNLVRVDDTTEVTDEMGSLGDELIAAGIRSYLAIPVRVDDRILGVMGFQCLRQAKAWTENEIAILRLCAELITSTLCRQRAEGKLTESEERFRALAENAQDAIVEIGLDRRFRYFNPAFCRLVGYGPDELAEMEMLELLHPIDAERRKGEFADGEMRVDEPMLLRVKHSSGTIRWAESTRQSFDGADGEVRFAAVIRDVTERENRRALADARQSLENTIGELSRRFLALEPRELDDAIRGSLPDLAKHARVDEAWLMDIDRGEVGEGISWHWYRPDGTSESGSVGEEWGERFAWAAELLTVGEVIHLPSRSRLPANATEELKFMEIRGLESFLGVPLIASNRLIGILGFEARESEVEWPEEMIALLRLGADLYLSALERKRADASLDEKNRQLMQSQKMEAVGTLAGGIAHDFNNQLSVILGNARFLESGLSDDPDLLEVLADLEHAGEHCADLTRSLLAFSRHSPQPPRSVEISEVLAGVGELLRPLLPSYIDFELADTPAGLIVHGDPNQLQQGIINLGINARDAMPDGGTLSIEARLESIGEEDARQLGLDEPGEYVSIRVRDDGVGMDADIRGRIFEPFFTTKSQGEGTGLGLAMVYGMARECRGVVDVESRVGRGSTFRILLPTIEGEDLSTSPAEDPRADLGGETILIVEDEARVRRLLKRILVGQGYRILEAADGREALEVVESHDDEGAPIAALVTDVVMPRMGGLALAQTLLESRPDLKVLFHSGYSSDSVDLPGSRFIQKPFDQDDLVEILAELLVSRDRG